VTTYLTCKGYSRIATGSLDDDAPTECRRLELEQGDGYAVIAMRDGKIVADADGWADDREPHYTDAATATGMYDHE
jgi:hypothetical protein